MRRSISISALLLRALARLLIWLGNEPVRNYRPEAHYMRGPGPAWRAKHGVGWPDIHLRTGDRVEQRQAGSVLSNPSKMEA
jgi:hypothetical protein